VAATPAEHDDRRRPLGGPRAKPLGYVVSGSRRGYFAGDTDLFAEMTALRGSIDLALLPVAGWGATLGPGHLDADRAAEAAARIAPRVAIPIHWGTLAPRRPLKRHPNPSTPPREFANLVARETPGVEVRVIQPGERTVVD
jgi:L-ascorbate metabolism protein UlaG (beta-lactamase superfamily)